MYTRTDDKNNKANRKGYIDAIKGWLMLLVIWSHSQAWVDGLGYFLTAGYMGAFFFLLGYTEQSWDKDSATFIKSKSKRLLIPYLFYGIILIVSIPAPIEPPVRSLRAAIPATQSHYSGGGNHHSGN